MFQHDLATASGKAVTIANDANCLARSEATDGAGADGRNVFAVIIGTGCGGGLAINGDLVAGASGIAGEWGHSPLPSPTAKELPGLLCWCGRWNCIERWVSGTGIQDAFREVTGESRTAEEIVTAMRAGEPTASAITEHWMERLGRSLAAITNLIDPDIVVFGDGLVNVSELYERLPALTRPHAFSDHWSCLFRPTKWGDSSGVRGAAWLRATAK